jgi:hypothetical protein
MTCIFSPSSLNPDGSGNPVNGTLTINTNGAAQAVASSSARTAVVPATVLYLPGGLTGLLIAFNRKRIAKSRGAQRALILVLLLAGAAPLVACGGSSTNGKSQYAAPGSYSLSLTAGDSQAKTSHSIEVSVQVE